MEHIKRLLKTASKIENKLAQNKPTVSQSGGVADLWFGSEANMAKFNQVCSQGSPLKALQKFWKEGVDCSCKVDVSAGNSGVSFTVTVLPQTAQKDVMTAIAQEFQKMFGESVAQKKAKVEAAVKGGAGSNNPVTAVNFAF